MYPARTIVDIDSRWEITLTEDEVNEAIRELYAVHASHPESLFRWMQIVDDIHAGMTHREVAQKYSISRARAFQLYWNAMKRILDQHKVLKMEEKGYATRSRRRYSDHSIPHKRVQEARS